MGSCVPLWWSRDHWELKGCGFLSIFLIVLQGNVVCVSVLMGRGRAWLDCYTRWGSLPGSFGRKGYSEGTCQLGKVLFFSFPWFFIFVFVCVCVWVFGAVA